MAAIPHRQASKPGKPVWEASRRLLPATTASLASKCDSRALAIKALENWTLAKRCTSVAYFREFPQCLLRRLKIPHLRFYVSDLGFSPGSDCRAGCAARHSERQEFCDLGK